MRKNNRGSCMKFIICCVYLPVFFVQSTLEDGKLGGGGGGGLVLVALQCMT